MTYQEQSFVPFAKQIETAQAAVEQNPPAFMFGDQVHNQAPHSQPCQEPRIKFSIVSDEEELHDHEDDDEDSSEAQDTDFRFFGEVIQLSDDDDDFWSDSSSDPDSSSGASRHVLEVCGALGACYRDVDNKLKTFYQYVEPDSRTSCNITAAALKEPVSLLTKYRLLRFEGRSKYFRSAFSGPPNPIRRRRQRSPLLIDCPGVRNKTTQRGLFRYKAELSHRCSEETGGSQT